MEKVHIKESMKIVLIADTFPPLRTSGAVQLRDLSREFINQGHELTVLLPSASIETPWQIEDMDGVRVLRLKSFRTKDINYIRRTFGEILMPFRMRRNFRKSPFSNEKWDGVVWYAPSIFHGPLANFLKKASGCKGYLIIRDIFPNWAVDMGLMGHGIPYFLFIAVARYQYSVADVIGVQSRGNCSYFNSWKEKPGRVLEVLPNWLAKLNKNHCSIRINETSLVGRKVFVYAGNMGVAQGMDIILELAKKLQSRFDVGFLFVGRGSDADRLKKKAIDLDCSNVLFFDEIHPDEIGDLYEQCSVGLVALDPRHKSHNIPGKFLTYMQCGLPVLANVNAGNDIVDMIVDAQVGQVCESNNIDELVILAETLLKQIELDEDLPRRCKRLFEREFLVKNTVRQLVSAFAS